MRRSTLTASVVLTCAAAAVSVGGAASAAQSPAAGGTPCSTTQPLDFSSLVFGPPAVYPGHGSSATATVINCTAQTQQGATEWYGRYVSATGTGIPAGCPVIDPVWISFVLGPHVTGSTSIGYYVPTGCTANGLIVTVEVVQNGNVVAKRSAELIIEH